MVGHSVSIFLKGYIQSFFVQFVVSSICLFPTVSFAFDGNLAVNTFKKCKSCHQIGEGAKNKIGPNLNGLQDKSLASDAEYKYSKALRKFSETGIVWNQETLDVFLKKPKAMILGTKMGFSGLKKEIRRKNLIEWILQFDADGNKISGTEKFAHNNNVLLGTAAAALIADAEYGEYLSGECVTCHKVNGHDDGIPSIIKWPNENFIDALYQYKTKIRENAVMQNVTKRLGDAEMAALAAYFGSLPSK